MRNGINWHSFDTFLKFFNILLENITRLTKGKEKKLENYYIKGFVSLKWIDKGIKPRYTVSPILFNTIQEWNHKCKEKGQ